MGKGRAPNDGHGLVAMPFRVAAGFLMLMFLWGFLTEESSMMTPEKYEYDHIRKEPAASDLSSGVKHHDHGSYMPWKSKVRWQLPFLSGSANI